MARRLRALLLPLVVCAACSSAEPTPGEASQAGPAGGTSDASLARIDSPRALFDEIVRLHTAKNYGGSWDLLSDEGRRRFSRVVDESRETLRRNPDNPNIARQYQVSDEEFLRFPADELWRRSLEGTDRVLFGAKVISEAPAPGEPGVVQLDFETTYGQRFRWFVHEDGDRGWRLRNAQPLQLERPDRPE